MRIDALDLYHVHLPLIAPFNTAYGDTHSVESLLVRFTAQDAVGWGEGAAWAMPGYCCEYAAANFDVARRFLAPLIAGKTFADSRSLLQALSHIKGNYFAKAPLDQAWWDLHAKLQRQPLWRALGGRGATVDVGADFGVMPSIDDLLHAVGQAVAAGFKRVKLKFKPGWDVPMVQAVRNAFPDLTMHIDCNAAYSLDDTAMFQKLDAYNLAMIEQPLAHDDLIDHAALQRSITTPICLDESITSPAKARKAIAIGACRWINVKPGRVGGMTPAMDIIKLCAASDVPCWIGGMLESNIGAAHCLALATLPNVAYPCDVFPSDRFYKDDLADPPMQLSGPSQITALDKPGIGFEVNEARLQAATIQHVRIEE